MNINTRNIQEGHSDLTGPAIVDLSRADFEIEGKVLCTVTVDRRGTQIHLRVEFSGQVRLSCSRCLEPFVHPVNGFLRLVLEQGEENKEHEMIDFWYSDEQPEVDIGPAVLDEIIMAIPMKPLCSEECPGTQVITKDSPRESAANHDTDPRWEALKKLKERSGG